MEFPCTKCGACCRRAGKRGLMPSKEDGSCIHLLPDNTCSIYTHRPPICNVHDMFDIWDTSLKLREQGYTREEYYAVNSEKCNEMMDEDGLPEHFRIDMRIYDEK